MAGKLHICFYVTLFVIPCTQFPSPRLSLYTVPITLDLSTCGCGSSGCGFKFPSWLPLLVATCLQQETILQNRGTCHRRLGQIHNYPYSCICTSMHVTISWLNVAVYIVFTLRHFSWMPRLLHLWSLSTGIWPQWLAQNTMLLNAVVSITHC